MSARSISLERFRALLKAQRDLTQKRSQLLRSIDEIDQILADVRRERREIEGRITDGARFE
jgi:hypothetical protein